MGITSDGIENVFTLLCQNPDTGVVPSAISANISHTDYHEPCFTRYQGTSSVWDEAQADRLVDLRYQGHGPSYQLLSHTDDSGPVMLQLRIRYRAGDDPVEACKTMGDDFHLIRWILDSEGARNKVVGIHGYVVTGSDAEELVDDRAFILSIDVRMDVSGVL